MGYWVLYTDDAFYSPALARPRKRETSREAPEAIRGLSLFPFLHSVVPGAGHTMRSLRTSHAIPVFQRRGPVASPQTLPRPPDDYVIPPQAGSPFHVPAEAGTSVWESHPKLAGHPIANRHPPTQ